MAVFLSSIIIIYFEINNFKANPVLFRRDILQIKNESNSFSALYILNYP